MFNSIKTKIKPTYDSKIDNISKDFYDLVLSESITYKRVSCYFSAKSLASYAIGLENFAENGGYMQLIISEDISYNDFREIKKGYEARSESEELSLDERRRLGNLAYLISMDKADVRIGFVDQGLFHSKWGLFKDKEENIIYFNGSNNETYNAIHKNFESFDVDVSWDNSEKVKYRIQDRENKFNQLWENKFIDTLTIDISDLTYDLIKDYNKGCIEYMDDSKDALLLSMNEEEFFFIDNTDKSQTTKKSFLSRLKPYTHGEKGFPFLTEKMNYIKLDKIINETKKQAERRNFKFHISPEVFDYINRNKYSIEEYRKTGLSLKDRDLRWQEDFKEFSEVVAREVHRPLLHRQLESSFYMLTQKRAANFSVPGAGKTAMILGIYAYLNSSEKNKPINRMLVICPKNAFSSWKKEFKEVFGKKKELKVLDVQKEKMNTNTFENEWMKSNLILVNYESTRRYKSSIIKCLKTDNKTMLIFDEVHRIKGLTSSRAAESLDISRYADYKYVLTGTPIPNSYQDIFNFLNIMYFDEYDKHFGFTTGELKNPDEYDAIRINDKLSPYFWRVNKNQLDVPEAEDDEIIFVEASSEQQELAKEIFSLERNPLAIMIRMIQLSTNPSLINKAINLQDLGLNINQVSEDQDDYNHFSKSIDKSVRQLNKSSLTGNFSADLNDVPSPKFIKGISIVEGIVKQGRKVMVWALFVDTIDKIKKTLVKKGIRAEVIYGATSNDDRDKIIDTFNNDTNEIQVLISNPNTLGESVSLHKCVHDAVYFEYNYNLTFMLQSRDRIHRLGLKPEDKTRYYFLMTESNNEYYNFIDKKIYDRLKSKEERMKIAIDGDYLYPEFTDEEFNEAKMIIESERRY